VKRLYDVVAPEEGIQMPGDAEAVDAGMLREHLVRKHFLGVVIADLLKEIDEAIDSASLLDRWFGKKKSYPALKANLERLQKEVQSSALVGSEIPVLQKITRKWKTRSQIESGQTIKAKGGASAGVSGIKVSAQATVSDFDKTLEDNEIYNEYSDIVVRSFPFQAILEEIQDLLNEVGLARLVVFFDDFSELKFVDQKLFVDVVLVPLNNSSNDRIKLKIAGYPGRVYYGKIDSTKVDTISLDFSDLFEATEVQTMENSARDYAERLIQTRFNAFGESVEQYFESSIPITEHFQVLFQTTFNVPRLMGALLHICYLDRVSKGLSINPQALRLASRKYYEATIVQYFDRMNRFALEPFENKMDRQNQHGLLKCLVAEARRVRSGIQDGTIGGTYFRRLTNPPTSHFIVTPALEKVFHSLESNFFLTKYKNTRDKSGDPVIVYAFYYGLTEAERMSWGYPKGREYRNYFVQRSFDYSAVVHNFLTEKKTIRCNLCGQSFPLEDKPSFERYKWRCPECNDGTCSIVDLKDDFVREVEELKKDLLLEKVELEILNTLHEEKRRMRSGEISALIDATYQLVGKRTTKLQESGFVAKERDGTDGTMRNSITKKAINTYFRDTA
jgi:hypothetical protein